MNIKPIQNDEELDAALEELERLGDVEPGTPEGDRSEVLALLVEAYENEHYPVSLPDPISALEYYIESRIGVTKETLVPCIGSMEMVEAILSRKVHLTLEMVHKLDKLTHIGVDVLAQPYETEQGYYSAELTKAISKEVAYGNTSETLSPATLQICPPDVTET